MKLHNDVITRTEHGYAYNGLEAIGLPPRESQALLLRASGKTGPQCAAIMGCSAANIANRISNLFYKLRADSTPELITKAFKSGTLRFMAIMLALHLGTTATITTADENYIARSLRCRMRSRARNVRILKGDGGLYWVPETNEFIAG